MSGSRRRTKRTWRSWWRRRRSWRIGRNGNRRNSLRRWRSGKRRRSGVRSKSASRKGVIIWGEDDEIEGDDVDDYLHDAEHLGMII